MSAKWLALVPLALEALNTIMESKGGWEKYLPEDGKKGNKGLKDDGYVGVTQKVKE